MLIKTAGIILHSLKYGETSIIARIYTRELGLQSYLVHGVRKAKTRVKQNLFQPLTNLDLVVYHKEKEGLHRIKEVVCPKAYISIPYNIQKSAIAMFLAEMLQHALKNQDAATELYDFLNDSFYLLDNTTDSLAVFHLVFLIKLSRYLGFQPRNNYDRLHCFFNLQEGMFQTGQCHPAICLNREQSMQFLNIMNADMEHPGRLIIPKKQRKEILNRIVDYYGFHLDGMPEVKSLAVLETVLN